MPIPSRLVTYSLLALINVSLAFACKTHSTGTTSNQQSLEHVASQELGKDFTIDFNESKTFALCNQKRMNNHINSIFKYCVISVSDNKIVYTGSYQQGSVKWLDNNNIEITIADKASTTSTKKTIQINPSQQ